MRSFDKGSFECRAPTGPSVARSSSSGSKRTKPLSETEPPFAIPVPFTVYSSISGQTFLKRAIYPDIAIVAALPILHASSAKLNDF
jgi:hypothetical protein